MSRTHLSFEFSCKDPAGPQFRAAVGEHLGVFLDRKQAQLTEVSPLLTPLCEVAREFTATGKRLRPAFGYWGFTAVADQPGDPGVLLTALAGFELLHASALVHDDVIDDSDLRRGQPAVHRRLAQWHRAHHGSGDADAFGRAGAILLGDLMMAWSVEITEGSGLEPELLARGRSVLDAVRTEVNAGQFLDMSAEAELTAQQDPIAVAEKVVEYKTARYTVIRPLQYGAALAGADPALLSTLAAIGSPLGRAFQLRDDLLGVFGDEQLTGKPAGDDLRENKRTVLVAEGLARSSELAGFLGRPLGENELAHARALLIDTGAVQAVEQRIDTDAAKCRELVAELEITEEGHTALTRLVEACVSRDS
ncbi:polyprenyl synthetase family protein [Propionibacterium sp.]|uniref:polyprenyl synthetase family protein n=1 Tax=Propionibacterium sp. TaxID=1977903 RepID=UPI0039EAB160